MIPSHADISGPNHITIFTYKVALIEPMLVFTEYYNAKTGFTVFTQLHHSKHSDYIYFLITDEMHKNTSNVHKLKTLIKTKFYT